MKNDNFEQMENIRKEYELKEKQLLIKQKELEHEIKKRKLE